MGTASIGYPFGIAVHSHGNSAVSPHKLEFSRSNFPLLAEFSRINQHYGFVFHISSKSPVCKFHCLPDIDNIFWDKVPMPILDVVENPIHLKNCLIRHLIRLVWQWWSLLLHHVFHAPVDKILWDAEEETDAHKILTGRRPLMSTLHKKNVLSASTSRLESAFDPFGAASTCSRDYYCMAVARDIKGKRERIDTVINNGSTMSGQIYEAMSNMGYLDSNMIVILNVSALPSTLSRLQSSKSFRKLGEAAKGVTNRIGKEMHELAAKVDQYAHGTMSPSF